MQPDYEEALQLLEQASREKKSRHNIKLLLKILFYINPIRADAVTAVKKIFAAMRSENIDAKSQLMAWVKR